MSPLHLLSAGVLTLALAGCEGVIGDLELTGARPDLDLTGGLTGPDAGHADGGAPGAGAPDAGAPAAGAPDAGGPAAGAPDAGAPDAGIPGAGAPDAGGPGAGAPDAGAPDAGVLSGRGVYGRAAVAAFDALAPAERAALTGLKVLFHHHSVGENLMGLWTDDTPAGGASPPGGAASLGFPFSRASSPAGYASGGVRLGELTGGANGDPAGKLASLRDVLLTQGFAGAVRVVIFKFCFVDFGSGSSVTSLDQAAALEATYRTTIAELQAAAPGLRILHVTPPLRSYWNSDGNDLRLELGRFLRAEYGGGGFVFDLQDLESHDTSGAACARNGVPVICDAYVGGTGHLTDLGATLGAKALLFTALQAATAP